MGKPTDRFDILLDAFRYGDMETLKRGHDESRWRVTIPSPARTEGSRRCWRSTAGPPRARSTASPPERAVCGSSTRRAEPSRGRPQTFEVGAAIRVGEQPVDVAAGTEDVWVASYEDGTVWRIERTTLRATSFDIGTPVIAVAIDEDRGTVWLSLPSCRRSLGRCV
jgi:hypothetical protein